MSEKILVPVLGESITEATVSKWLKNKGETVDADEPIVELETDKVNLEVPSPVTGKLVEINSQDGSTVKVGEILGLVTEIEGEVKRSNKIEKIQPSNLQKKEEIKEKDNVIKLDPIKEQAELDIFEEENNGNELKEEPLVLTEEIKNSHTENNSSEESQTLSPAVRKMVDENNIDVKSVKGSGKDGRILKGDLISLMGVNPPPSERKIKYGQEERIKMTRLRQTIAKRLKQAQENAALLTTFNEVDMTNIINMRKENQEDFQSRYGIKLGFMSFFVKACIVALKNFPAVNAEIDGDTIVYKNYYNISFAVGTEKGLVVPVLKNADELSFAEIEKNIKQISEKAKDGKLTIDQDGDVTALDIDTEATSAAGINITNPTQTTGNVIILDSANNLTTGRLAFLGSNSADTSTRNLVEIVNEHASATGATALKIRQDSTALALVALGDVSIGDSTLPRLSAVSGVDNGLRIAHASSDGDVAYFEIHFLENILNRAAVYKNNYFKHTNNLEKSSKFYDSFLSELEMVKVEDDNEFIGYARKDDPKKTIFYITLPFDGGKASFGNGTMVAFKVLSQQIVDKVH